MKISLNWLKKHIILTETPEEIEVLLTNCGLEVEDLYQTGNIKGDLNGLIVGHVIELNGHPNAERLKLAKVNIGSETPLNIVCGAPNIELGQKVVVATIGTTIYPVSGEPVTMKPAKIRGEVSEGMLCAEDEIGLGQSHAGLLILPENAEPGTPVKNYIKTDSDCILELGLTPNRGDAASHLGVARDLKAILNRPLIPYHSNNVLSATTKGNIEVNIESASACGRYSGLLIKNVKVAPSPDWLKVALDKIGLGSINNIVDITNYIMHDIGQPMHAFDADTLSGGIVVRMSKVGESLTTLDKIERKLTGNELIIADHKNPLALAGVMGGLPTAITENTINVFLESAWFDPAYVRKTAKIHGISTDSSFRFERGTNPDITVNALNEAANLILELAGGEIDFAVEDNIPEPINPVSCNISIQKFKRVTGLDIPADDFRNILKNLEIEIVSEKDGDFNILIPRYRLDVVRDIDIFEEVLRIYGYNRIAFPEIVHGAAVVQAGPDKHRIKQSISGYLAARGFNEIMTNSLGNEAHYTEQELAKAVQLLNPLSNEMSVMRPNLLPSLLEAVSYNKNRKSHDLRFFEFGKTYMHVESGFKEFEKLGILVSGNKETPNWREKSAPADGFYLKSIIENLLTLNGIKKLKGVSISEVDAAMLKKMDVKGTVFYAEINMDAFWNALLGKTFIPEEIPVFPEVVRDLNLVLDKSAKYSDIEQIVVKTLGNYLRHLSVIDVYEGKQLEDGKKSYTLRMVLYDHEKTMTDKQIDSLLQKLIAIFENQLKAEVRK